MISLVNTLIQDYSQEDIEASAIRFFIRNNDNIDINNIQNRVLINCMNHGNKIIENYIQNYKENWEICDLINLFEALVPMEERKENGVVFTPKYIAEYIIRNTVQEFNINDKILDPSCGCGAFLCVLPEILSEGKKISIIQLIENNIYGLDISENHIRRTKLLLSVIALINGEDKEEIKFNIIQSDSLKNDWNEIFEVNQFEYIIGNPPYVNTHDMSRETASYLKNNFKTTKNGTFNIFYAFIEQSMKYLNENGRLGFIVPNNFITIDAAKNLRSYLIENEYISRLIDFNLNLAFNPVKAYNAIIFLDKNNKDKFEYSKLPYNENIQMVLLNANFEYIRYSDLNSDIWHLMNESDRANIRIIENIGEKLDKHIRTGIATLKDKVYKFTPVREDEQFYYMNFDGNEYSIEKNITKSIIKISEVNNEEDIRNCNDRIIFPYEYNQELGKYTIIPEENMMLNYPNAYSYLEQQRHYLEERSSQQNAVVWYEYGRSQALSNYGIRLIHPTFSSRPKFMIDEMEDRLFVNGYAIFIDRIWEADVLQKILNSKVMNFYIRNTSYSLEGGFFCYQKKYFKNFSIPNLSEGQIAYIRGENDRDRLDEYIINIYGVNI